MRTFELRVSWTDAEKDATRSMIRSAALTEKFTGINAYWKTPNVTILASPRSTMAPVPMVPTIRVVSPRLSAHVGQLLESITSILLRKSARNLHMVVVEVTPTVSIPRKSARNDVKIPIPIPIPIKTTMKTETGEFRLSLRKSENRLTLSFFRGMGSNKWSWLIICNDVKSPIDCLVLISF